MAYQSKHTGKQIDDGIDAVGSKLGRTDDLTNNVVTFVEAPERTQIASGETAGTLFGKILKWLKSLGMVAFSNSYNDLNDKPTIPTKTSDLQNDSGYINNYTETDPTVPSYVKKITQEDIAKWNEGGVANILVFENKTVATTAWLEDTTYEEFGYKADILCEGVTDEFFSDVVFGVAEAVSGNYAPISVTGAGIVTIFAVEFPSANITIPTIICSKGA